MTDATGFPPGWIEANTALDEALKAKGVDMLPCAVCGQPDTFQLNEGYFIAPTSSRGDFFEIGHRGMPLLPLVCRNCGNTIFLNALKLGLGVDLFTRGR